MKKLLLKEYKLVVLPLVYVFFGFILMLFIPSYPYTLPFYFITMSLFYCFLAARENNDLVYMMTLPIPKEDVVKSRYLMMLSAEIIMWCLAIPICIIRSTVLDYDNKAGIDANIAMLGLVLFEMAVFNANFTSVYFKDCQKVGISFLKASIWEILVCIAIEASVHVEKAINGSCFWDEHTSQALIAQIPIFIVGLVLAVIITMVCYKRDVKNFKKQDL